MKRYSIVLFILLMAVAPGRTESLGGNPIPGPGEYFRGDVFEPWEGGPVYYRRWTRGPSPDAGFFPIAVWLQDPANAAAYKDLGVNLFVGLWDGPTVEGLRLLSSRGMPVFCEHNGVGAARMEDSIIQGWTQIDEPDNAQPATGGGWTSPLPPSTIQSAYQAMKRSDPTRPIFLNFGLGVVWDGWYGRRDRSNHPEDYARYMLGGDIICFDVYPTNTIDSAIYGKLWLVAAGVERLRGWSGNAKAVWNWIECTRIDEDAGRGPTPAEVRAEVWMALVHGSRGIGYFVHKMNPFDETGLLHDPAMATAVSRVNAEVTSLARVLNTQTVKNGAIVRSSNYSIPVDVMVKRWDGFTYLFAVAMRPGATSVTFTLRGFVGSLPVEVMKEGRTLSILNGAFQDSFVDHEVHIYRICNP